MTMTFGDRLGLAVNSTRRRLGLSHNQGITPFFTSIAQIDQNLLNATPLHSIFFEEVQLAAQHKWLHYLEVYHENLSLFRGQPVKILEVGVSRGGSLAMWRRYFGAQAVIFGIDIDSRCRQFNGAHAEVRIGSQADPVFLHAVVEEMGGLDIVIDDGSHISSHMNTTFDTLFKYISNNGLYICEDLHCSYWSGRYEGGYRRKSTFIEKAKRIVDDMHVDFHAKGGHDVSNAHRSIKCIKFYNSMVVIQKGAMGRPSHLAVGQHTL